MVELHESKNYHFTKTFWPYHSLKEFPAANASISPWWKTTRIGISCSRVQNTASIHTFDAPSSPVSCPWWTYQSKWMMCPRVSCPNKTLRSKINLSKVNSFSCNPASVKDCLRIKNVSVVKQYWKTKNVKHAVWYPFVGFLDKQTSQKSWIEEVKWPKSVDQTSSYAFLTAFLSLAFLLCTSFVLSSSVFTPSGSSCKDGNIWKIDRNKAIHWNKKKFFFHLVHSVCDIKTSLCYHK